MTEAPMIRPYKPGLSIASLIVGSGAAVGAFILFMAQSVGQQPSVVNLGYGFFVGFSIVNAIICVIQMKTRTQMLDLITAGVWIIALSCVLFSEFRLAQSFHPNNPTYRMDYFIGRLMNWLPLYFILGTAIFAIWGLINNAMAKLTK